MFLSYSEVRACHAKSDEGTTSQPGDIEMQSHTTANMVYVQSEGHIQGQIEKKKRWHFLSQESDQHLGRHGFFVLFLIRVPFVGTSRI